MIPRLVTSWVVIFVLPLIGCQNLASRTAIRFADDISSAVLDQDDPDLVREGAPAYLIAIDGLIEGDPENQTLLLAGARLYAAYNSAFVTDPERAKKLALRARQYGDRALCLQRSDLCHLDRLPFEEFEKTIARATPSDLDALYGFGSAWAAWIQANTDDWNAIAQIPHVQALMERVVELQPDFDQGGAQLYLGILYTLRPASMGGRPELGRRHFEAAIEYSHGRNLTARLLFARQYARLVFDRDLHDRLLNEVVQADPKAKGFTLANVLAQEEARRLLAESDDYF